MNELDHASLEASKKLVDSGIITKTDAAWYQDVLECWNLLPISDYDDDLFSRRIPAPCFTEVWRELPEGIKVNGSWAPLFINKIRDVASVGYRIEHHVIVHFSSKNPTDALIELLVWVKGAGK